MFLLDSFGLVFTAIELLLLIPLVMYLIGKAIKINSEHFKFVNCIWIIFISGLISGFVSDLHWIAGVVVFLLLIIFLVAKQFQAPALQAIVISIITVAVGIGLQYLNPQMLSLITNVNTDVVPEAEESNEIDMGVLLEEVEQKKAEEAVINWSKYENSTHGFSFDYPNDLELIGEATGLIIQNKKSDSDSVYGSDGDFFISFMPYISNEGSLLKTWFLNNIEYSTDEKVKQKLEVINNAVGEGYMTEKDIKQNHMTFFANGKFAALFHTVEFQKTPSMEGPPYTHYTLYAMPIGSNKVYAIEGKTPTGESTEEFRDLFWDMMYTLEIE